MLRELLLLSATAVDFSQVATLPHSVQPLRPLLVLPSLPQDTLLLSVQHLLTDTLPLLEFLQSLLATPAHLASQS